MYLQSYSVYLIAVDNYRTEEEVAHIEGDSVESQHHMNG